MDKKPLKEKLITDIGDNLKDLKNLLILVTKANNRAMDTIGSIPNNQSDFINQMTVMTHQLQILDLLRREIKDNLRLLKDLD